MWFLLYYSPLVKGLINSVYGTYGAVVSALRLATIWSGEDSGICGFMLLGLGVCDCTLFGLEVELSYF